mgnify:CR=1 FL=1
MDHRFSYLDENSPFIGTVGQIISASSSYLPYSYEHKPVEDPLLSTHDVATRIIMHRLP